ncbi:hypothetical protein [Aestuariivirga litoralis]|uniref:hypothetical protein n=1 Tax=Aestuariivirga litoralis TaxID=2650924 RepID=UPI0018C535BD|nr:hypothetical protein [Aestuariivirga litoralis]MBG1233169.1 hypothetical protein [Aestuariivirga litoralis]
MIKMFMAGLWGVAMVGVGAFLGVSFASDDSKKDDGKDKPEFEQVMTEMTAAPIIVENHLEGYLVFRIKSLVDKHKLTNAGIDLTPYLVSSAFEAAYQFYDHGVPSIRPSDLPQMSDLIATIANRKLGSEAVSSVQMDQFNYVPSDKIRENILGKKD